MRKVVASGIRTNAMTGIDPRRPRTAGDFNTRVDEYLDAVKHHRSYSETKRTFKMYVKPQWGDRKVEDFAKNDVSALLYQIERRK